MLIVRIPSGDDAVILRFDDYRHALEAYNSAHTYVTGSMCTPVIHFITISQYNEYVSSIDKQLLTDENEGHVYVLVTSVIGPLVTDNLINQALAEVKAFGTLHIPVKPLGDHGQMASCVGLHLDFCSIKEAAKFMERYNTRSHTKLFKVCTLLHLFQEFPTDRCCSRSILRSCQRAS